MRPRDFVLDETLCSERETRPKLVQEYSAEERTCVLKRRILAVTNKKGHWAQKRTFKRESESMWEVDLSRADQGYFDQKGNFSVGEPECQQPSWLVKKGTGVYGPFTEREMREKMCRGELEDSLVGRDTDKGFVPYSSICTDLGDFLSSGRLDEYFEEKVVVERTATKQQEFFDDLSSVSVKIGGSGDVERSRVLEGCAKTRSFLHSRNPSVSLNYLGNRIHGKSFSDAVCTICSSTGLKRDEGEVLLNMLLDESKLSILSDVCPDGFVKAGDRPRRKGRR